VYYDKKKNGKKFIAQPIVNKKSENWSKYISIHFLNIYFNTLFSKMN